MQSETDKTSVPIRTGRRVAKAAAAATVVDGPETPQSQLSSASGKMPAAQKRYASEADWNRQRDVVTRLYSDENRPLKEVMQIMEHEHHFSGT